MLHGVSVGGNEKISLGDIFQSIDKDKFKESDDKQDDGTVNTNKLRKQIKSLKKETERAPVLAPQLNGRKKRRQEMALNYDINVQNLRKWIGQVKRAREEVQSDFTTPDKILHGGKVALNSLAQMASNINGQEEGADGMEAQVLAEMKKQGLSSDKDLQ